MNCLDTPNLRRKISNKLLDISSSLPENYNPMASMPMKLSQDIQVLFERAEVEEIIK